MNIFTSALLLTIYGVFSSVNADLCAKERHNVCIKPGMGLIDFPTSLGELQKSCPTFLKILRCLLEYQNLCGSKYPGMSEIKFDEAYVLMTQACNKNSAFHLELGSSLSCLHNLFTTHINVCQPLVNPSVKTSLESHGIYLDDKNYAMKKNDDLRYHCLTDAMQVSCFIARTSVTCGDQAENMMKDILSRVEYVETLCGEEMFDELAETILYAHKDMEKKVAAKYCESWSVFRLCDRKPPIKKRIHPFW
ncbi:hypothetical protein JTE90_021081 [Oedothorax gibbosus]|uniref:Secreted protein n=1 Tax=Oedothorax gibbosus TaxID=931172 RepID=A0AAV6VSN5_9ARAC|nr:hypothetical protein JTE90_021081 [Oedothorax gibbosus]